MVVPAPSAPHGGVRPTGQNRPLPPAPDMAREAQRPASPVVARPVSGPFPFVAPPAAAQTQASDGSGLPQAGPETASGDLPVLTPHGSVATTGSAVPPPAGAAPPVAQQVARAIQLGPGRVEVTLAPEELGRVSLTVVVQDQVVTVHVAAERAETGELLRRQAEILAAEAREEGFGDVSFTFSGGAGRQGSDPEAQAPPPGDPATHDTPRPALPAPGRRGAHATETLDLRL